MRERDIHGESASLKFTTQSPFHRKLLYLEWAPVKKKNEREEDTELRTGISQ